ncbi:MAG: hypothetical protein Q9227_009516 [Pyrenula ochraceoflavens]
MKSNQTKPNLGTAEGYRRCKEEVIGPWAARTYRKWHWYEFRYETRYTVPDIDLLTPMQYVVKKYLFQNKEKGPFFLNTEKKEFTTEEIYYTVHPVKGDLDNELLVSWVPFLRELHHTYNHYWGKSSGRSCCARPDHQTRRKRFFNPIHQSKGVSSNDTIGGHQRERFERKLRSKRSFAQFFSYDTENMSRSDIVVIYRELSWDFMPSEVVRPLAMTHLGPLVIMILRLGMQWQELNPSNGIIRASGNGYSLSSTSIRGLGMVIHFTPDLGTCIPGDLIPTKAADKMMSGIIPGCAELKIPDFPLISDNREVFQVRNLLTDISVSQDAIMDMSDPFLAHRQAWWETNIRRPPFNDAVILLCPFMSIPLNDDDDRESPCHAIQFPCWLGMEPCSVFTYYEGRMILLSEITKRVESFSSVEKCPPRLLFVQQTIAELERDYPDFFYGHYLGIEEHPCPRHHGRVQKETYSREKLISTCGGAFEQTNSFFQAVDTGEEPGRRWLGYKHIVGAHVSFAKRAAFWVRDQGYPGKGSIYLDRVGEWPRPDDIDQSRWHVSVGAKTVADVAWAYTQRISDFVEEIHTRKWEGFEGREWFSDDEIEEMWWMLMLRGICWALSVRIDIPNQVVPSSYYANRTPVWIT